MLVFYTLAAVLALVIFLAAIAPKKYDVSRTISIDAPSEKVFPYLKYLKNQQLWSPWAKRDPNMQTKFTGTDGEPGALSYWNGNKEVGEGEQDITKVVNGKRVEGGLRFLKPYKSTSQWYLDLEDTPNGGSRVTWGFKGRNKFPMSIMMLFMNMDKMIGKDFEEGLASLKKMLET